MFHLGVQITFSQIPEPRFCHGHLQHLPLRLVPLWGIGDGFTVTPAASPSLATLYPQSVRMMKLVASLLAPQVQQRETLPSKR
ncbi:uncharacterized protein LOC107144051 isoform X3 [Marmota marmota marmota]|uniref:uncharacterized protein LOC107144051 isoform X3 n=1 Tax=Marmota marmota marmota TaxID=9994 RepID=UPI0020939D20|nr:uncharacterized protein LOC107144051 isoform X3 [Marmota marmota marmota]